MDKNIVKGNVKEAEGKLQEGFGKATHSTEDVLAGKAKQVVGSTQKAVGHASDDIRKEAKKNV
jgi:uncharacterized protein YjbJ (UPF0337 family)